MKGIKKHLVTLLSAVLMMTSLGIAPALADDAPLGNDDFNIVVNKKLNPKDLTLDLKIKLEDKDTATPKVVSDLSQVFKDEGKENEKLDLVKDKTDEYEMVVSENGEVEFELNYSKQVKAAEGEAEAINRDEKHNFKVNVTEIEEAKAEEPKVEEPKAEEPKVQEPAVDEDVVDAPVITGPSVDAINKEGLTAVDTTDGPYTVDLDQKIKDINLKIAIGYGDTSSSLKNGLIKFDFKNSNYDLVSYSSLAGKPEIKKVTWNAKTDKILTIELKDNIRPDFEINLTVKPKAIVPIGTNLSINYEFSGESSSGDIYKTVVDKTKDILTTGSSYVPGVKVTKAHVDANLKINNNGWWGSSIVVGTTSPHWSPAIITSKTAQAIQTMSFDNLIIKRQNEHGYEKFPNRTTINTGFYRGEGTKVSENSSETILELGPVDMNVLTIAEDMKVPTDAFIGPYNVKYDIYNGDEYLFTHTKTINVIAGKTSYSFYTKLSDQTIGIGEKTRFSLIDGFSSGPNPMKNFEAIYEIPNQLTIESFGPSNENLKNVSVELNNSGTWTDLGPVNRSNPLDLSSYNNITKLKFTRFDRTNLIYGDGGITLELKNKSLSTGQSVDVKLISINYTDTHGNLVKVGDDPALQAKFSQTINGSSGPVQTSPTNVKIGYSEGDGWGNGPYWPKAKVTKFTAKINPVIGANDGEGLKKPFIYLIAPKGAKITQGVPSIVGLKYRNPNTINDGPALDYLFPSTPSTPKIDTVELSDGRIMYYAAAENTIRGNASSLEILQSRLLVTLEGVEKGIYDFELGVGSLESDNYNVTEANGYTQNNINSEVKSILGASSSKVYTKKLQAEIDANYETSRKSFVRAPESSNFTEIITGNEFAKVMPSTDVDFKYELKNTGSVLLKELEFIDILPFPGDKNITNGLNRGSEFPVYLGNDPKVSKGGAPIGVAVYYSTSSDPKRLNSSGSQIGTGEWTTVKPAIEDIKAIKLKLVDSLKPGETVSLDITGKLNFDAPRAGEKAYNTIAFNAKTVIGTDETIRVTELPRTGVQAKAPTNAGQISGTVFQDVNKNAVNDSETTIGDVVIDVYETSDLSTSIHTTVSQSTGDYGISNLANGTYNIRVTLPENTNPIKVGNKGLEIDATDSKYAWVVVNGSRDIKIDDVTSQTDIKNIDVPMTKMSSVSGMLKFVDKNSVSGAAKYAKDWTVELFNGSDKLGSVTVTNTGEFKFENLLLADSGNLKLKITNPNGKTFTVVDTNVNAAGEKTIAVTLGTKNTTGTTIEFTDTDMPVITGPTADKAIQPTDITYSVKEDTTDATEAWTIKNASGATVASGTKQADVKAAIAAIATAGEYTFEIVATDAAKNEAKGSTTFKFIPKTAGNEPTLNITGTDTTVELGSALPNLKTAFGVTATDKLGTTIADTNITTTEIDAIPVDGSGNVTIEGTYKVKLEVTDPTSGLKANKEVTVSVVDSTAPVLTVTPTTINLNLKKGEANALTFDVFAAKHLKMSMKEAGSQTGIKLQSDDYSVDFANNGTNTFKVYVVDNAAAKNKSNEVTITVEVAVYDDINTSNKEAINAHDFNIKLSDVNDANIKTAAEVAAFDIDQNPAVSKPVTIVTPLPTTVGDHKVKFETAKGTSKEVTAHVFDDIDPVTKEAINAHDFNIKLSDVNDANLIAGAEAAAFDVTTNTPVSVAIATVTHAITGVGNYPVKFETAKGTSIEVTAHVFDDIDPVTKEAINAHDFNIKLSDVNDANLIAGAEAAAFDVTTNTPVSVAIATVTHAITGVGNYPVKFETAKGTSKEVTAHVFDDINPVTKEAINAHDFNIKLSDVNDANLIAGADAAAFDVTTNTPVSVAIATVTHSITSVGDYPVKFETAAGTSKEVTAHVYDEIDPINEEAINAQDFVI